MFIAKNNDLIILAKDTRKELEQALGFMIYTSIEETDIEYQLYNGEYLTPEEVQQKEQERINNLTMTPLDFIGVLQSLGLTLEQINAFLESNLNIKMQLTYCNSVYCGVVKSFLPITIGELTITPEMVESAFIAKNGG